MDKHYGCKRAFGTSRNDYGQCLSCPLATAEQAQWLMRYKGMTMGEAVKATVRLPVSREEGQEIIKTYEKPKEPYPEEVPDGQR